MLIFIYLFSDFTPSRRLVCLPVSVNHGNWASPLLTSCFSFSKSFAFTCQDISLNARSLEDKKGDDLLQSARLFLSGDKFSTLHIISEGEVQCEVRELTAAS